MRITAAVTETKGAPFTLQERELGEPGPGEVLVRVAASGICRTDLICRDQWILLPRLMELYLRGRFPVDRLMTFYDFDDIERAAHDAETGASVKSVLKMS